MNDKLTRHGVDKIVAESDAIARDWRKRNLRLGVAIIIGAMLYVGTSPDTPAEYLSVALLVTPLILIAANEPKTARVRRIVCSLCLVLSLSVYLWLVA